VGEGLQFETPPSVTVTMDKIDFDMDGFNDFLAKVNDVGMCNMLDYWMEIQIVTSLYSSEFFRLSGN
jgi:hypothetical protein